MTKKKKGTDEVVETKEVSPIISSPSVFDDVETSMKARKPGYDESGSGLLPDQEPVLIIKGEKQVLTKNSRPERGSLFFTPQYHEGYGEETYKPIDEWWKYERGNLAVYMSRGSVLIVDSLRIQSTRSGEKCILVVASSYVKATTLTVADDAYVHESRLESDSSTMLGLTLISATSIRTKGRLILRNVEANGSNIRVESCDLRDTSLSKARIWGGKAHFFSTNAAVFDTTLGVANVKCITIKTHVRKLDFNNYNLATGVLLEHRAHYGSFGSAEASFVQTQDGIAFNNFEIGCAEWLGSEVVTDTDSGPRPWTPFQPSVNVVQVAPNTKLFSQLLAVASGNPGVGINVFTNKITKPNALQRDLVDQISAQITSRMQLWQTISLLKEAVLRPDLGEYAGDYY